MLLTKNFLYFINEFNFCMINNFWIKRKIPVVKFEKITLDVEGYNCLVHIQDEDDIFLSAGEIGNDTDEHSENLKKFKRIVKELDKAYTNQTSKNLPLFRIVIKIITIFQFFKHSVEQVQQCVIRG
jgi:hypothetical protein